MAQQVTVTASMYELWFICCITVDFGEVKTAHTECKGKRCLDDVKFGPNPKSILQVLKGQSWPRNPQTYTRTNDVIM